MVCNAIIVSENALWCAMQLLFSVIIKASLNHSINPVRLLFVLCSCLVHLSRHGVAVDMFAPDQSQAHVINHLTGEPSQSETRLDHQ